MTKAFGYFWARDSRAKARLMGLYLTRDECMAAWERDIPWCKENKPNCWALIAVGFVDDLRAMEPFKGQVQSWGLGSILELENT